MRLVSLNTWGGQAGKEKLLDFFACHSKETDVFCLQEIWRGNTNQFTEYKQRLSDSPIIVELYTDIAERLPGYKGYFSPTVGDFYGLAIFIRDSFLIQEVGERYIYREAGFVHPEYMGDHARSLQYITVHTPEGLRTIINIHGLWQKGLNKVDCPDRLTQSERILEFTAALTHPYVLCGDFNLKPDTESFARLTNDGLRNLNAEYGITSTRTPLYPEVDRYADYILASRGISVQYLSVLPDVVSDHAPLQVDFI